MSRTNLRTLQGHRIHRTGIMSKRARRQQRAFWSALYERHYRWLLSRGYEGITYRQYMRYMQGAASAWQD